MSDYNLKKNFVSKKQRILFIVLDVAEILWKTLRNIFFLFFVMTAATYLLYSMVETIPEKYVESLIIIGLCFIVLTIVKSLLINFPMNTIRRIESKNIRQTVYNKYGYFSEYKNIVFIEKEIYRLKNDSGLTLFAEFDFNHDESDVVLKDSDGQEITSIYQSFKKESFDKNVVENTLTVDKIIKNSL